MGDITVTREMRDIRKQIYKKANYNDEAYAQLVPILTSLLEEAKAKDASAQTEYLVKKFAKMGYADLYKSDKKLAMNEAKQFLVLLFGGIDSLLQYGPDDAMVRALYERSKMDKYQIIKKLGEGGQAIVKLGVNMKTKEQLAVKIFKAGKKKKDDESFTQEVNLLKALTHKNILRLIDSYEATTYRWDKKNIAIVELCPCGEVIGYLSYIEAFDEPLARWFFKALIDAVEYCHKNGIVHRDLKHDNCLFGENFVLKVTDFGYATRWTAEDGLLEDYVGTREYAAPEVLENRPYDSQCDIFSMGVMLFVLVTRSRPFKKASERDLNYVHFINQRTSQFWDHHKKNNKTVKKLSINCQNLITAMILPDPAKRVTLQKIRKSAWLKDGKTHSQEAASTYIAKKFAKLHKKARERAPKAGQGGADRAIQEPCLAKYKDYEGEAYIEFVGRNEETGNYMVRYLHYPDNAPKPVVKKKKTGSDGEVKTVKKELFKDNKGVVWNDCPSSHIQWPDDLAPEYHFERPDTATYFYSEHTPSSILDCLENFFTEKMIEDHGDKVGIPDDDEPNVERDNDEYTMKFAVWLAKQEAVVEGKIELYHRRNNPLHCIVIFKRQKWNEKEDPDWLLFPKVFEMAIKGCGEMVYLPGDAREYPENQKKGMSEDEKKEYLSE